MHRRWLSFWKRIEWLLDHEEQTSSNGFMYAKTAILALTLPRPSLSIGRMPTRDERPI